MISMIWRGKGTQGRVVRRGEPISFPTKAVVPVTGAAYSYINQPIPGAAVGTIYHNAPNLTLDINSLDKNGNNHYSLFESLPPACTITIGTQSAMMPVKPTYVGGGMWNLTLDAWPALPDGNYNVTITKPLVVKTLTLDALPATQEKATAGRPTIVRPTIVRPAVDFKTLTLKKGKKK